MGTRSHRTLLLAALAFTLSGSLDLHAQEKQATPATAPDVLEILRNPVEPENESRQAWNAGEFSGYMRRDVLEGAIAAVARRGDPAAAPLLMKYCHDDSAWIRHLAGPALAKCLMRADATTAAEGMRLLHAMLQDPHPAVALEAAKALAEVKDPSGVSALVFDLRRAIEPFGEKYFRTSDHSWHIETVVALEKITGKDLGSSLGEKSWQRDVSDENFREKFPEFKKRVEEIIATLKQMQFQVDTYPQLPEKLTDADKAMFDRAFANWLVDPRGGKYVSFEYDERDCWGKTERRETSGWLYPANDKIRERVLLEDRAILPAPAEADRKVIDLIADAKAVIKNPANRSGTSAITAAWLYRLGEETLAAKMLFLERGSQDNTNINLDRPYEYFAWRTFATAIHAYMVRADDEALAAAERMAALYAAEIDKFGAGTKLLAELRRRKQEGTFNKAPALPEDFDSWPAEKRAAWLITNLQEVDARQQGQPGGVSMREDWRIKKLIEIGDAAVPALIDCIENDERLTRSVTFWRDFSRHRSIVDVRDCAFDALYSILRFGYFEPFGDNAKKGEESPQETARQIRKYWDEFGKLPFEDRMAKVITNANAKPGAVLAAARNLARWDGKRRYGPYVWTSGINVPATQPNAVVAKYKNPTVAEAVLAGRDLAMKDERFKEIGLYYRGRVDDDYAEILAELGDVTIVPKLKEKFTSAGDLKEFCRYGLVCYALNDHGPLDQLAADLKAGKLKLRDDVKDAGKADQLPASLDLVECMRTLLYAEQQKYLDAIAAMEDVKHPYHDRAVKISHRVIEWHVSDLAHTWMSHPLYIKLTRPKLDDVKPGDEEYLLADGSMVVFTGDEKHTYAMHDEIRGVDPAEYAETPGRIIACDQYARRISDRLIGAPLYHPGLKNAGGRLEGLKYYIDLYAGRLRLAKYYEEKWVRRSTGNGNMIPDFKILDHPATAAEVAAGMAIFHLDGAAKVVADFEPSSATFTSDHGRENPPRVLIYQAEVDAAGVVHYGIVGGHFIRQALASELEDIRPLKPAEN